jgi:hypothetical protein
LLNISFISFAAANRGEKPRRKTAKNREEKTQKIAEKNREENLDDDDESVHISIRIRFIFQKRPISTPNHFRLYVRD